MDSETKVLLRAGMSQAFQSYTVLRRFVADNLNRQLADVTNENAGLTANFDELLIWAEEGGWLTELLTQFEHHGNPTLKGSAEVARPRVNSIELRGDATKNPLDSICLSSGQYFIGRENLRKILREMDQPSPRAPVLVVAGRTLCGKSYSYQLLRLLDHVKQSNIVARIDFNRFRTGAIIDRYRDIVNEINLRIDMSPDKLPPPNESEVRWFEHVVRKFDHVARQKQQRLWLVFDHLPLNTPLDTKIIEAIIQVITYAVDESLNLRVVVIGQDPQELALEPSVKARIKSDYAELPREEDVLDFLSKLRMEAIAKHKFTAHPPPTDSQLKDAAAKIMEDIKGSEENSPHLYSAVAQIHATRLQLVES